MGLNPGQVEVANRGEWGVVSPQTLVAEIRDPGRTRGLPAILPHPDVPDLPRYLTEPTSSDVNNIHLRLPGDQRAALLVVLNTGKSFGQYWLDYFHGQPLEYNTFAGHSLKFLTSKVAQFYDDVTSCLTKLGVTPEMTAKYLATRDALKKAKQMDIYSAHIEKWASEVGIPLYKALRALGYSHVDIAGA